MAELYLFLQPIHYWLSRLALALALIMFLVAVWIGLIRHRDVTRRYRQAAYAITGLMLTQAAIGAVQYFIIGIRPAEEVHLIYGLGSILALPFFIFVETTAKKRPAMGSYIWGFAILAGILLRGITTGAH